MNIPTIMAITLLGLIVTGFAGIGVATLFTPETPPQTIIKEVQVEVTKPEPYKDPWMLNVHADDLKRLILVSCGANDWSYDPDGTNRYRNAEQCKVGEMKRYNFPQEAIDAQQKVLDMHY